MALRAAGAGAELRGLFEVDLLDHGRGLRGGTPEYDGMRARDAARRERAAILAGAEGCCCCCGGDKAPLGPADLYHAAWLFHHGDTPGEAERASRLAGRAAAGRHAPVRWLSAAASDRWHMYRGLPQRFGTQIVPDGVGFRVWDTDPSVTDEERAAVGVPPLAEQERRAEEAGRSEAQPPLEGAPGWLRDAIARWAAAAR